MFVFFLMIRLLPISTRTDTLVPCSTLVRSFCALAILLRLRVQRRLVGIGGVAGGVERIIERLELGRDRLAARLGLVELGLVGGFDLLLGSRPGPRVRHRRFGIGTPDAGDRKSVV